MRFTVRLLGTEVFHVDTERDSDDEKGDAMSMPVGFTRSVGDEAVWQTGVER